MKIRALGFYALMTAILGTGAIMIVTGIWLVRAPRPDERTIQTRIAWAQRFSDDYRTELRVYQIGNTKGYVYLTPNDTHPDNYHLLYTVKPARPSTKGSADIWLFHHVLKWM